MLIEVVVHESTISIPVTNIFHVDLDAIQKKIEDIARAQEVNISMLDLRGLFPAMIKGIAGCEQGCPADAKSLIRRGYQGFDLHYIEGGILAAKATTPHGYHVSVKMFPDF
jgi:hypothetical protein